MSVGRPEFLHYISILSKSQFKLLLCSIYKSRFKLTGASVVFVLITTPAAPVYIMRLRESQNLFQSTYDPAI